MKVYVIQDGNGEGGLIPGEPEVFLTRAEAQTRWSAIVDEEMSKDPDAIAESLEAEGDTPESVKVLNDYGFAQFFVEGFDIDFRFWEVTTH